MAPIIVFAFNRPQSLVACIESLKLNLESEISDLFIFVDGYRENIPYEMDKVLEVRNISSSILGFRSVTCTFSDINQGLGPSIINGVSEIINKYGSAIIVEDDLLVQPNFLKFMNEGLEKYQLDKKIWSICGYTNKIQIPFDYKYDVYFCPRSSSWGWATWADRWNSVDWTFKKWDEWIKMEKLFNKWGGSDCFSMLKGCKEGKNKSWAIRFCFNQFLQDKLSLFPVKSLVKNDGFDGNGTNCKKWSRFKYELMPTENEIFIFPSDIVVYKTIYMSAMRYNSILSRIISKIMYAITSL